MREIINAQTLNLLCWLRRKRTYGREELSAEAFPHKADLSPHEHIDYEGVWLVVRTADRKRYLMSP